ncbi:hypothetical protein ABZ726_24960, partial [Streptomyces hundungensis]|uniref:hypothetical protein n=1 Tax=Streptomyces hundungensis TaxID=1077946 RepID=UPI0033D5BB2D
GVRHADTIHVLHQGRLIESGNHQELMARPDGRYRAMFLAQAAEYTSVQDDDSVPGPRPSTPSSHGQPQ